jgi:NAD-dependent deacetylase
MTTSPVLPITDATHVLVLTGAGVSAESGVPTFRDAGGLWQGHDVTEVASPRGFAADPALVWQFYAQRRAGMTGVEPNPGHRALAALEARLGDRFLLVTQNVDGLHRAAGSERVLEIHGNLMTSRCTGCRREPFPDRTAYPPGELPRCDRCRAEGRDALLRPHIVWFGEAVAAGVLDAVEAFFDRAGGALVFLQVGTSGVVYPAAGLVEVARGRGARAWLVNAEPPANASFFDHVLLGPAGRILPGLLGTLPDAHG